LQISRCEHFPIAATRRFRYEGGMKKLIALCVFLACVLCLGACADLPPGTVGDSPNYGSSTPR